MISELINNKSHTEKANIKAVEIAKLPIVGEYHSNTYGLRVEIQSLTVIDGGIQIMARAWKKGNPLGFGADGSIEIERFKVFNPPILIDSPEGTITEKRTVEGKEVMRTLKEDPIAAIQNDLAHTISLVGKENINIVSGKIGTTTSTFFPATGANSPVNGRVYTDGKALWTLARDAANADAAEIDPAGDSIQSLKFGATYGVQVGVFCYDTSPLGTDTINSATHSWYTDNAGSNADTTSYCTVQMNLANTNNIVVADFSTRVFTSLGSVALPANSGGYNDISLNSTGLSVINKTGVTKFGWTTLLDVNNTTPTGINGSPSGFWASHSGTSQDPKLVVVSTPSFIPGGAFLLNFV